MDQKIPTFLKRVGDSIVFNQDGEFQFYIPEIFFDRGLAAYAGEFINVMGIMNYCLVSKTGTRGSLKQFNYPTRFLTNPYKVDKIKGIKLTKESEKQDYRILRYKKGNPVIVNIFVPEDIENTEQFLKLFAITGAIPNTIGYDELQNYFIDNISYNGASYNVALQLFGVMISELCRAKDNIDVPFRLSGETNMKNYTPIGIKTIAKIISPYSAITSENFNESVVYAALNDSEVDSPLENIVTGKDL